MQRMREQFSGDFTMNFNLAPPMLPGHDASGRPKKRRFGAWMMTAFKLLARFKGLRGTPFDPFGYFPERRMERRLVDEYRTLITETVGRLNEYNLATGIEVAHAAWDIAGYGPVKEASAKAYAVRLKTLLDNFETASAPRQSRAA
jgi:indolepyruvate ferredoxin oxidoreductase